MSSGRELDGLIAEKLFGFIKDSKNPRLFHGVLKLEKEEYGANGSLLIPFFSTDVREAIKIVKKLARDNNIYLTIEIMNPTWAIRDNVGRTIYDNDLAYGICKYVMKYIIT